ncbi:hypothetical protein GUJ93_ZPchr0008g12473 [Zizania palustris]|uniref:Uncharacterized protein n=1 Tax=Zizania palustris TaxID=103762 RepID=A0A8J5VKC3_ZIZPA|nr:hypothetical protein GUJ93_ZPchr0008g12473 [Zizania palustris]
MDAKVPPTVEAPDTMGHLPSSPVLGGGPATASGAEVERSGPEAVTMGSEPRVVTTDSEAVAPESASMGLETEVLQAR